jgi:hypothetical protein
MSSTCISPSVEARGGPPWPIDGPRHERCTSAPFFGPHANPLQLRARLLHLVMARTRSSWLRPMGASSCSTLRKTSPRCRSFRPFSTHIPMAACRQRSRAATTSQLRRVAGRLRSRCGRAPRAARLGAWRGTRVGGSGPHGASRPPSARLSRAPRSRNTDAPRWRRLLEGRSGVKLAFVTLARPANDGSPGGPGQGDLRGERRGRDSPHRCMCVPPRQGYFRGRPCPPSATCLPS